MKFTDIKPADLAENEILLRVFGEVELENKWGRITDSACRSDALTWVVIKYLLVNSGWEVNNEEILGLTFEGKAVTMPGTAMRTRLSRSRALLKPLKLNHLQGLILVGEGKVGLNTDYTLISDEAAFNLLMGQLRKTAQDDPAGLELCAEALEIMRGVYMGHTTNVDWLDALQQQYKKEALRLCRETLSRMKTLDDDRAFGLLWRRAVAIVPEAEELHREILSRMVERRQELELLRYVSQLSKKGAKWLEGFEY